jgi:hypothetical protein
MNLDMNLRIDRIKALLESYIFALNKQPECKKEDLDRILTNLNILPDWEIKSMDDVQVAITRTLSKTDNSNLKIDDYDSLEKALIGESYE